MPRLPIIVVFITLSLFRANAVELRDLGNGDVEAATTSTLAVFRHGSIVSLKNVATEEEISSSIDDAASSVFYQDGHMEGPSTDTLTQAEISGGKATQTTKLVSGTTITTIISSDALGNLTVRQSVDAARPGVESFALGLPALETDEAIHIPTGSGLRLDQNFAGQREFEWPRDWRVQKAFLETAKGAVLVEAADPQFQYFKSLNVQSDSTSDTLHISLSTQVPQPVVEKKQGESALWAIRSFEGSWQAQAAAESDRILASRPADIRRAQQQRSWVRDIRLVVTPFRMRQSASGPLNEQRYRDLLLNLSKRVDPASTLINFAYDWRNEELDTGMPGQEVNKFGKRTVEYARSLGFKVMLSIDFRCDLRHALYPQVRLAHMRYGLPQSPPYGYRASTLGAEYKSFVQRPLWKVRAHIAETQLAAINPALKSWREFFLRQMSRVLRVYKVHAVHVTGISYVNDANGLIEGMNSIQGYRELLKEVRSAVPAITVLSVDAWDETTLAYADMAQLQLPDQLEVNPERPADMLFDDQWLDDLSPVSAELLRRDFPPYSPITISPSFPRSCAAWDASTACIGPIPHAAGIDDQMLQSAPPSLQARLQEYSSLRELSPITLSWNDAPPLIERKGDAGIYQTSYAADEQTVTMKRMDDEAESVVYSANLNGHYEVPAPMESPEWLTAPVPTPTPAPSQPVRK